MGWTNLVTVEPAMFLQQAGDTLTYVIFQNLFIEKICRTQLEFSKTICDVYTNDTEEWDPAFKPVMDNIQASSSNFLLYNSLVENSLPVFLVLFLGVWSDLTRRRKPPLLLSLCGKLIRSLGLLLNGYFMGWSPIVLLLTVALPHSLGGANAVFHMAAFSYIADSSVPRNRTWRLGIAEACWQLGSPVGLYLGAYLFQIGGYICVFGTAVIFHFVAVLYTWIILPEVPQPRPSLYVQNKYGSYGYGSMAIVVPKRQRYYSENERGLRAGIEGHLARNPVDPVPENNNDKNSLLPSRVEPSNVTLSRDTTSVSVSVGEFVMGSLKAIVQKRPSHTRKCLLSIGTIMLLYGITFHGEGNMKYLFTRNKFQWREQEFSFWTIFDSLMVVMGLTVVMPIFSKLFKFSDPFSGLLAAFSRCMARLCIALAPSGKYLFVASMIDVMGVIGPLCARSLASKCVLRDERGKVFAFLGCIEALVPLMAVPLYSLIYSSTLTFAPSIIYYVSVVILVVIFAIFGILFVAAKLSIVQFTGTDTSALLNPRPNRQNPSPASEGSTATLQVPSGFAYMCRRTSLS